MVEAVAEKTQTDASEEGFSRVYEIGYHIIPTVAEDKLEKIVGDIRSQIEKAGGSFIAEGAPSLMRLSYEMTAREGDKNVVHDRGYFGWIKFEANPEAAVLLDNALRDHTSILRHIVFKTVREDTRAKMKAPTLREVKRTDTIKTTPRREEEVSAPVSEADLDKALEDLTTE
ncbi:MAG: 30S ribosomal protein S6 [Candidatus Kaiserbacteria bacterium]|nr:30S ribosomal protein S6 [Candidatus Kaiserbacteria bacterium]